MASTKYTKKCPKCNREYPAQAQHCGNCGSQLIAEYKGPSFNAWKHMHDIIDDNGKHWVYVDMRIEPEPGLVFEPGYYDDEGDYYSEVEYTPDIPYDYVLAKCPYCESIHRMQWKDGAPLVCANCGAPMRVLKDLKQTAEQQKVMSQAHKQFLDNVPKIKPNTETIMTGIIMVIMLIIFIIVFITMYHA